MFFKDTFFAFRMLFKNPVVNGIAILSLALGIGASTAIFTLTSSLFLSPLPHLKDPDRLVKVFSKTPFSDYGSISYLDYRDFRNGKAFTVVGVAPPQFRGVDMVQSPDVWIPLAAAPEVLPQGPLVLESRGFSLWRLVGRLKPGAGLEQARADLGVIARRLNHEFP